MKITDNAKEILESLLNSNGNNCLKISEQSSCCGTNLVLTLAKASEDDLRNINGINVMISDATLERAKDVTIDAEDGQLTITDEKSKGCC